MNMPMRGAGTPQGSCFSEFMMQDVAMKLGVDSTLFREKHLLQEGDHLINHQAPETLKPLHDGWNQLKKGLNYESLAQQVKEFNSQNRYKKRGVKKNFLIYFYIFLFFIFYFLFYILFFILYFLIYFYFLFFFIFYFLFFLYFLFFIIFIFNFVF